jgi:hypothetical protein
MRSSAGCRQSSLEGAALVELLGALSVELRRGAGRGAGGGGPRKVPQRSL